MTKWTLFQGCKESSTFANQSVLCTILTNWKVVTVWFISIDAEKAFDKIQHPYDKNSPESKHRRNIPQHNKSYIWHTHCKYYPQWQKIESIFSKIRSKTHTHYSPLLFNSFGSPSHKQSEKKKKKKESSLEKKENSHCLQMIWSSTSKILNINHF